MKYILFICLSLTLSNATAQQITQQKYQLPLLIGKERNPVLRLAIHTTEAKTLNGLTVMVPANPEDINQVQLFASNQDSTFITDAKLSFL